LKRADDAGAFIAPAVDRDIANECGVESDDGERRPECRYRERYVVEAVGVRAQQPCEEYGKHETRAPDKEPPREHDGATLRRGHDVVAGDTGIRQSIDPGDTCFVGQAVRAPPPLDHSGLSIPATKGRQSAALGP
jgi:hypothetical protein